MRECLHCLFYLYILLLFCKQFGKQSKNRSGILKMTRGMIGGKVQGGKTREREVDGVSCSLTE